ncbi:MAG: hypothetical protein KJ971_05965 [Firmicutes bacterium]|nr:hypothetical protein [Bacillota bacterium]
MKKEWNLKIGENEHKFEFIPNHFTGKPKFFIDGEERRLATSFKTSFLGLDTSFSIEDQIIHLVVSGNKADIAVDKVFVDSKKPYIPLKKLPIMGWVFISACFAIPIVALGGLVPTLIGLGGAIFCARLSGSPYINPIIKFLGCVAITGLAWGVYFVFLNWILSIL